MTITAPRPARAAVLLISVVVLVGLLLVFAVPDRANADAADAVDAGTATTEVVVVAGDSLWAIAERHAPAGQNIAEFAFEIRVANGLDSSVIHPGQMLVVPSG